MRICLCLLAAAACGDGDRAAVDAGPAADGSEADGAVGSIWAPAPGTSWQWQLAGQLDTSVDVAMFDIDLVEAPDEVIADLRADGRILICYFSAGSRENYRPDADDFPDDAVGKVLDGWPDERWLDVRDSTVRAVMETRLDLAVSRGCDGVEPDNVDAFGNDSGFPLTADDQIDYNRFLADAAHARGLSVGLKNDVEQVPELVGAFDWALDEECLMYDECDALTPFIAAGKAVFHVEYGTEAIADEVCAATRPLEFSTLIKRLNLNAWRVACR